MRALLILAAFICGIVATILGFKWFGTDGENVLGWLAASLTLFYAAHLAGDVIALTRRTN